MYSSRSPIYKQKCFPASKSFLYRKLTGFWFDGVMFSTITVGRISNFEYKILNYIFEYFNSRFCGEADKWYEASISTGLLRRGLKASFTEQIKERVLHMRYQPEGSLSPFRPSM